MDNTDLDFYKRVKKVHESIYADALGGSCLDKCFLMAYLFKKLSYKNYVEIGVYRGKSLFPLAVSVQENGGTAYGIDPYLSGRIEGREASPEIQTIIDEVQNNLDTDDLFHEVEAFRKDFGFDSTVRLLRKTSDDAVPYFRKKEISIDMLHIDGNHDSAFIRSDDKNYVPLVRDGGIIVFDDIDWVNVRKIYEEEKKKNILVYETDTYGIIMKPMKICDPKMQQNRLRPILEAEQKAYAYLCDLCDPVDLLIIDDLFPYSRSGFRMGEFSEYLKHFKNMKIYSSAGTLHLVSSESVPKVFQDYKAIHPENSEKVVRWHGNLLPEGIQAKLAYFCFLNNAYYSLDTIERNQIPFVLELHAGGGFAVHNFESDKFLRRVTDSPYFRKVLVPQSLIHDYLVENEFCREDQIITVFGLVMPIEKINKAFPDMKHFGFEKDRLDVCFAAMKYTPQGKDKGYDVFIEAAERLCAKYSNIYFHVVGNFDENVIDISKIKDHIVFYGSQDPDWFDDFYTDKDIFLSPNCPNIIRQGAFDGFPTACCVDAGLRETAMFSCDEMGQNRGYFKDRSEIVIIEHDVGDVVRKIEYYYQHPGELKELGICGSERVKELYSWDAQMKPRIDLLQNEIDRYPQNVWFQFRMQYKRCADIIKDYHAVQKAYNNLETGHRDLQNQYNFLEAYAKDLQSQYNSLEAYAKDIQSRYNSLDSYTKELQNAYSNLKIGYDELQILYAAETEETGATTKVKKTKWWKHLG